MGAETLSTNQSTIIDIYGLHLPLMLHIFGEATSPLKNKNSETCLNMDNHPGIKDFLDGFHG